MMHDQPIVQLHQVTKRIGGKTIIDNLSFDVPRGEVFGFLGPNGAGKTTTIRMMVGLMSVSGGEILINGLSIKKDFERAIRHVGAIVENPEMYKYMSGYHNLVHYARMVPGITGNRINEVVELVGLQNRIKDKVKTYSLGMRQRLGVAQALLHKPSLLILDEPTNGLDPAGIRELRDYLRLLAREEGTSVVVSSHLLAEMELMCDRAAIIQRGKLVDVRQLKDEASTGNLAPCIFEVDDAIRAEQAVQSMGWKTSITAEGLTIYLLREQIPEANARLVNERIQVFGIKPVMKSLEDKFLEITRGETID